MVLVERGVCRGKGWEGDGRGGRDGRSGGFVLLAAATVEMPEWSCSRNRSCSRSGSRSRKPCPSRSGLVCRIEGVSLVDVTTFLHTPDISG
jgi:hypothetical protein